MEHFLHKLVDFCPTETSQKVERFVTQSALDPSSSDG